MSIRARRRVRGSTQIESEVAALERELAEKRKILDAIRLVESNGMVVTPSETPVKVGRFVRKVPVARAIRKPLIAKPVRKIAAREYGRLTWTDAMWRAMQEQTAGVSYRALLRELIKGELGENRSKGDKGFYQAIRRMVASGDLVKIGGLLYTADLAASLRARGEVPPATSSTGNGRGSRSIILAVLSEHPRGLTAGQIKEKAAKHPNAPSSLRSESHYIYNVLGQMKKVGEITHEGNVYRMGTMPATSEARAVH